MELLPIGINTSMDHSLFCDLRKMKVVGKILEDLLLGLSYLSITCEWSNYEVTSATDNVSNLDFCP